MTFPDDNCTNVSHIYFYIWEKFGIKDGQAPLRPSNKRPCKSGLNRQVVF